MVSMPFLTQLDSRAKVRGSRDPLGVQAIWTRMGRHVVGNLTTVSTSVRDFTTTMLGYYFAERVAEALCSAELYEWVRAQPNVSWGSLPKAVTSGGKLDDVKSRTVHAKVYRFFSLNPKSEYLFVGSVNLTDPAHKRGGNLETGFLVEVEEQFVKRGLPAAFLADFGKLVDELEKAATAQLNSRTERRLARAGIEETLEQGLNTIRERDVFVPNALRLDPIRVAAWRGARRIEALNQPPAKKPAPAGDTAPTPPQTPKSAAGTVFEPATAIPKAS